MRVLIHAGIHRTGTTNLQIHLSANRDGLAAQGVAYPGEARDHQALAWAILRREAGAPEARALVESAAPAGTVLLSGEDFALHEDLGWLRDLARAHDVRAVLYLRRQDDWLNSWYNQHVKWPFNRAKSRMSPGRFLKAIDDFPWIDFDRLLDRWARALGEDRVAPAVVEPGQVEDVTADFCARAGVDMAPLTRPEARSNDSLPPHVLEIARHLGLFEMSTPERIRVNEALRKGLAAHAGPARTVFSPAQRNAVLDRFEASNRAAARRWFGRDALFLAPRPGPDEPWARLPEIDRDTLLRDWIAPVVRELARRG